jgi:NAD(P)-dependent dehydrogenase (short-subunit alcohol dehydrogenase family)
MTTPSNVLEGKIAIVTGAASPIGMGRSITTGLVRAGARVAMLDINQDWLDQTANDLREVGGDNAVLPIIADVTDPESVESAVARTIGEMGGLHILVNNAGINPRTGGFTSQGASGSNTGFWDIDPSAWLRVVDVNLSGPFLMSHAVSGHMLEQGYGRIIGVTTSMDTMWRKGGAPYGPSKAGHEALISIMAQDLEGTGVTANVLTPGGATATNMVLPPEGAGPESLIQPEVMQSPVVWIASDAASHWNGRRIIAYHWDDSLPLEERLEKCSAPAAWPQLGIQSVHPDWFGRA